MRITAKDAREYFAHPTQRIMDFDPDAMPDEGFQYWALGPICGVFHGTFWPGVWMAHYGVKPEGWGRTTEPAKTILRAFWAAERPSRIIGWTPNANRAALSFARRIGFTVDGTLPLEGETIVMTGWTLC